MRTASGRRTGLARGAATVILGLGMLASAGDARAQGFVSPSIGFNFGDHVPGCEEFDDCEVRRAGYGVGIGYLGSLFGFEQEITYSPSFFGDSAVSDGGTVTTIMSNLLLALPLGPVRPYGTAGLGAIRTSVDFDLGDTIRFRDAGLGWVLGGGVLVLPTEHFGLRADVRYYRGTDDFEILGVPLDGSPLAFSRASASVVIAF